MRATEKYAGIDLADRGHGGRQSKVGPSLRKPALLSLKRRVSKFFSRGIVSIFSTRRADLRFMLWKRRNPGSNFSNFYAGSIAAKLERGRTHKTLGSKHFLSGFQYFCLAKEQGLQPQHVCVDYGCGSFRVGSSLIDYLDPGNYWGLDVVSDFYEAGKTLLPAGLYDRKRPHLRVINTSAILEVRQAEPDFVLSFAVLQHVPPEELDTYFANITALMTPRTKALITFKEASKTSRTGSKIWAHCIDDLAASIRRQGAGYVSEASARKPKASLPRKSVLTITTVGA